MIDAYLKVEYSRLQFMRNHQTKMHLAPKQALREFHENEARERNLRIGRQVILPARVELTTK